MFRKDHPNNIKMRRGTLLWLMYLAIQGEATSPDDPTKLSARVLRMSLEQLGELPADPDLHGDLRYIESKGYVQVEWKRDGSGGFLWVKLCTSGTDLVEGTSTDPGVLFEQRRR